MFTFFIQTRNERSFSARPFVWLVFVALRKVKSKNGFKFACILDKHSSIAVRAKQQTSDLRAIFASSHFSQAFGFWLLAVASFSSFACNFCGAKRELTVSNQNELKPQRQVNSYILCASL